MGSPIGKNADPFFERDVSATISSLLGNKKLYVLPGNIERMSIGSCRSKLGSKFSVLQVVSPFEYPPLPGPDYIRLLHLEPASHNPLELRGSLKVHKLDAQCEYEAISYAWGDFPKFEQVLFLDNQVLKITGNMYAALMAYSYPDRTRILWADAICINQADVVEKTQQVAMMGDIYSKAQIVQIWLTIASEMMITAMNFMANLASKAETFGISDEVDQPRWMQSWPSLNISDGKARGLIDAAVKAHVDYLLCCSWFNRVWVVQEVTLAAKIAVSCGHYTMDWTSFARALEILRGAVRQVPLEDQLMLDGIRPAWELVRNRDSFRLLDEYSDRNHHIMTSLIGRQMRSRACSDDRDRVYAMLAMTKSPYTITPDYDKTVAEAYTEFARKYSPNTQIYSAGLCRRQHPTVLKNVDIDANNEQRAPIVITDRNYLPSWVPEFRPSLHSTWASPFNGEYSTARKAPGLFFSHPEKINVLCVTGTIFDVIRLASWEYENKSASCLVHDPGFYFSVIGLLQNIPRFPPDFTINPSSDPLWLILAKTVTGGVSDCRGAEFILTRFPMFRSLSHLEPGSLPWLTAIWDRFATHCFSPTGEVFQKVLLKSLGVESGPLSADGEIAHGFLSYLANTLVFNRLFKTMHGYIGLAPRDIQSEDFVAIFNDCHMPYIVRSAGKVKYEDELLEGTLQVIGPCYLQGIMKGEIFTDRDAPQFSRLKWTRIGDDTDDSLEGCMMLI